MQSVIRFLKNAWLILFGKASISRHHALKAIFPGLWSYVWNVGWDRCHENMRADHESDTAELRAENAALRSQINQRGAGGKFTKRAT